VTQQHKGVKKIYEANGQDYFNYIARYGTSNVQIQGILEFKEQLDSELLKKSVRLSLDAEPILGCRFVEDEKKSYWERFDNIDEILWYTYEENEQNAEAVKKFLESPLGLDGQQQVEVKLIRCSKGDTVCIKVNHACSDGGGVKQYLALLAQLYTKLSQDPNYKPPSMTGRRDAKNYFDALGIKEPMALFNPQETGEPPTWAFPYHGLELSKMHVSTCRFVGQGFENIKTFAKERSVTIGTMILTAFFRSMFNMILPLQGNDMEIYVTIDLRKFIPKNKKQGICNLSSMMNARIARVCEESFEETLMRVAKMVEALKNVDAGLSSAVVMEALGRIDFSQSMGILKGAREQAVKSKKSSPLLSNIGIIPELKFGNNSAYDCYIITPAMYAPGFMLGVSSYNDILTLVVSYYEPSTRKKDVERFLNTVKRELEPCNG